MARWQRWVWVGLGLVALGGGAVAYGLGEEARLFALDGETGRVQWSAAQLRRGHHQPQATADSVIVSQSGLPSDAAGWDMEPGAPAPGRRCQQQGWSLTAYNAKNGQEQWSFCPSAEQYPDLDLRLTHGMRFQVDRDRVLVPLIMFHGSPKPTQDQLLAINLMNGQTLWQTPHNFYGALPVNSTLITTNGVPRLTQRKVSSELLGASIVQMGDRVAILTGQLNQAATIQAVSATTGQRLWATALRDRITTSKTTLDAATRNYLLRHNDHVIHIAPTNRLTVLAATTGKIQFELEGQFLGRTVVYENAIYQFGPEAIAAYDLTTGKSLWRRPNSVSKQTITDVLMGALEAETVYTRSYQFPVSASLATPGTVTLEALDAQTGKLRWQKQFPHPGGIDLAVTPVPSAIGVTAVVGQTSSDPTALQLVTLDRQTGATRWTFPLRIAAQHRPVRIYGLLGSNHKQVFVRDYAPRFRHWLARLNPNWH